MFNPATGEQISEVNLASKTDVDFIKFQAFIASKTVIKKSPKAKYQKKIKLSQYEMLKKYLEDIENGEITLQKIDTFGKEADFEALSELFDLIEQGSVDLHALKLYSIVYEPSLIGEVSTKKALNYVDMILAAMWHQEIEKENEHEIMYATLGFVIFGTDFIKRVKNGYKQLSYDLERLEEQIKNLVYLYVSEIENNTFIRSLSQDENIPNDSELLSLNMEELDFYITQSWLNVIEPGGNIHRH